MFDDEMILGVSDVRISEERLEEMSDAVSRMGLVPFMRGLRGRLSCYHLSMS